MTNSINEVEHADVILVTGSNTTDQHPEIGARIARAARGKARLIVVEPRIIRLSKFAAVQLRQRCGTDVAWINGFMHVIISEGLAAREFIETRTEKFHELKALVREYTPRRVEEITGIPAEELRRAARMFASAECASIVYSMGITQHVTGVDNVMSLANLAMLTGNVGKCSAGVNPLRGQNNVQGACDMGGLPNVFPGYQPVADAAARAKFEKAWGVEGLPDKPGLAMTDMMTKAIEGAVKALYIMGENPVVSDPDSAHVRKALKSLDFLVVQDIFLTPTAVLADVVLPGACYAEKDGTFSNTERRVQRVRKAVEPPGEALADWEIFCRLSALLGYPMDYPHPSAVMDELRALTPSYAGMRYDRLEPWGLQWPCPSEEHPGTCVLHVEKFSKGLGTFMPKEFVPPAEQCDDEYRYLLTTGRVYQQYHTGTMTRRGPILEREEPEPFVEVNPTDAKELGIRDGWMVSVRSRRGELRVKARLTDRVPEKTVFMPFHYEEAAANVLTNPALDPVAKIPEYKVCAVAVKGVS